MKLFEIAYARSGDKGDDVNIGVIAKSSKAYAALLKELTPERIKSYFGELHPEEVIRFELPNLEAINFILKGVLQGGGSRSLRTDAQGKALGQALLQMEVNHDQSTGPNQS